MSVATRTVLLAACLSLLAACPSTPKPPQTPANLDTGPIKPPALKAPAAIKLPEIVRSKLNNGLSVWVLPERALPLVNVKLQLRAGGYDDPLDRVGLASFTARMLRQGVKGLDADAISEAVDMAGASLSAWAGGERITISCTARREHVALCLRLVGQMTTSPTFPEAEMREVRDRLLGQVKQARDDPSTLAALHFDNMLFGDGHPDGVPLSVASVNAIGRADLVGFHQRFFVPDGAILGVSGDVDAAAVAKLATSHLGEWAARKRPPARTLKVKDPGPGLRVLLVDKPDLTQAFFTLGHAGIPRTHADRDAAQLLNHTLGGGGFSSRLMKKIRSEGGKTYGIRSAFGMYSSHGDFYVKSFTRTAELTGMLATVKAELERLINEPPSAQEVLAAKGKLAGGYPLRLQTPAALLSALMWAEQTGLGQDHVTAYPVRMYGVTEQTIRAAAKRLVRPGQLLAAVVGKADELAPLLEAAKIPFERVGYLEPISAARRKQKAQAVPISPAEQARAKKLLARALKAAGGKRRLARIKTLRMEGEAAIGPIQGAYVGLVKLPDMMRLSLRFRGMEMAQVLAGDQSHMRAGDRTQPLPPAGRRQLRQSLFLLSTLLPLNALSEGVRSRPVDPAKLKLEAGLVAVQVLPPDLDPATLVINGKTGRLVQVRSQQPDGSEVVMSLEDHRKVGGVMVPHKMTSRGARGGPQVVKLKKVQLNPKVTVEMITGGPKAAGPGGAGGK